MNKLFFLTILNLKRNLRNFKYLILTILLPVIIYYISMLQSTNHNISSYIMISMSVLGILINSILSFGTKLGKERSEKWFNFLKVSSISEYLYGLSQVISFYIFCTITIFIIFFIGSTLESVKLSIYSWITLFIFLSLGSIIFILLGLILSCFKNLAQPLSAIFLVLLSYFGGILQDVNCMSPSIQRIAKLTPVYNYANLSWSIIQNKSFPINSLLILLGYSIIFLFIYFILIKILKFK